MFLNDNYVGGEFYFPKHNIRFKPKSGSMIIFPKSNTYEWNIEPITQGVGYTAALIGLSEANMV